MARPISMRGELVKVINKRRNTVKLNKRAMTRTTLAGMGAAVLIGAGAMSASAHVTIDPDTTDAESYALLTLSVPHGCSGADTTEVAISIPEEFNSVSPTVNPNWDVEIIEETLDEPIDDGHGGELTERVSEIVYTAHEPLPDEIRDAFVLSAQLPDAAGDTLRFPVVQTCTEGEDAWIEVPAEGEDGHDLEFPAPSFEVTAAGEEDSHDDGGDGSAEDSASATDSAEDADSAGSVGTITWVALGLGVIGAGLGAGALVRSGSAKKSAE